MVKQMPLCNALIISDTNAHNPITNPSQMWARNTEGYRRAIVYVRSTLDKAVTAQIRGLTQGVYPSTQQSVSLYLNVGDSFAVAIGSTTPQVEGRTFGEDYLLPNIFVELTCAEAPSAGQVDAWIELSDTPPYNLEGIAQAVAEILSHRLAK